jgi:pimeloyl-ACP methyl ester carboxylesterase
MLPTPSRVLYLHGFASGPSSRKARLFAERLPELGWNVEIPDLAEGDFTKLTISGQLKLIERLARNEPVTLIGSSLGGYLAALYAARHVEVDRLILLAPAFCFFELWTRQLGPDRLKLWKDQGTISVYHYGAQREMPISYQLLENAKQFEPFPNFSQPALVLHGSQDDVVPISYSLEFGRKHENTRVIQLESGHELTDVTDKIWEYCQEFLGRSPDK